MEEIVNNYLVAAEGQAGAADEQDIGNHRKADPPAHRREPAEPALSREIVICVGNGALDIGVRPIALDAENPLAELPVIAGEYAVDDASGMGHDARYRSR